VARYCLDSKAEVLNDFLGSSNWLSVPWCTCAQDWKARSCECRSGSATDFNSSRLAWRGMVCTSTSEHVSVKLVFKTVSNGCWVLLYGKLTLFVYIYYSVVTCTRRYCDQLCLLVGWFVHWLTFRHIYNTWRGARDGPVHRLARCMGWRGARAGAVHRLARCMGWHGAPAGPVHGLARCMGSEPHQLCALVKSGCLVLTTR